MRPALYVLLGVLLVPTVGLVGDIVTDGKFKSTLQREPPLEVESSEMVVNLNADEVDGLDASAFALTSDTYAKAEVDALIAAVMDACAPRQYYLTSTLYAPDQAITACASGFHFANLYEILDVSNLRYASDHPDAWIKPDSGMGPPTGNYGWIRTGANSYHFVLPGVSNCDLWTSTEFSTFGSSASVSSDWTGTHGIGWAPAAGDCSDTGRVWCVED